MPVIVPPIKSQGIKTKLVPWIKQCLPSYKGRWIEPFMGTGVVAFNLAKSKALLADTNPHIVNFYKKIQEGKITGQNVRAYLEQEDILLRNSPNNGYDHYLEVRKRFNSGEFSPFDFLFLSRAGFNGMMRFGKKGNWNIPFCKKPNRFAPAYITKIVNQVNNVALIIKPQWTLTNQSFEKTIIEATKDDLIYCDPPYFGRSVDYFNSWTDADEKRLFDLLKETKAKFILSTWHHSEWRTNEMIDKYWNNFNIVTKDHFYHNGGHLENRKSVVEALVCNYDIPKVIEFPKQNFVGNAQLSLAL